ncbi:MAG: cyclic nucleotide-binding domain-containing protein [Anaerolineae bacterium]|nr:cyclic nucleotide-binding domain-containing protein [Anaerolineae bacterium]
MDNSVDAIMKGVPMSEKDDLLNGLLGNRRRGARTGETPGKTPPSGPDLLGSLIGDAPKPAETKPPTPATDAPTHGLTPLDLLALPGAQRRMINWLSRKRQGTADEVAAGMNLDRAAAEATLKELVAAGYVNEALKDGDISYRVVFRGTVRRGPVGLPAEIWARVDLDHMTFLRQVSLFDELTEDQLRDVASHMEERRYQRDEVILWQGNTSEHVFFIKSGIVGIARYAAKSRDRKALAYLKQGDILGEYSSLMPEQGGISSATATALTTVDTLKIKRGDFLQIMQQHSSVAISMARVLAQRLIATDSHFSSSLGSRLCLVISVGSETGATLLGNLMALALSGASTRGTIYTEQPESHRLAGALGISPTVETHRHPAGYDVLVASGFSGLPPTVRATLVYEQLVTQYDNIVIGVPSWSEEIMGFLIGYADQIIVVCKPDAESQDRMAKLSATLRTLVHPEKVGLVYVLNHPTPNGNGGDAPGRFDAVLPFTPGVPDFGALRLETTPGPLVDFVRTLADRLGRTNQVSIYIPTTLDVNQEADTTAFVERTLAFLGQRFGGATTNQARGVWNSADAGLVGENIHIVRSYGTQADVDRYLPEILDYMEQLKIALRQEAMALEINHKLMLI